MKYLSDELYVNIPKYISSDYMNYTVTELNYHKNSRTDIFQGRVYKSFGGSKLYLNDILASRIPNYEGTWIPDSDVGWVGSSAIVNIEVTFDNGTVEKIDNLYYYYKDLGTPRGEDMDLLGESTTPKLYNFLNQRTKVLPKVPGFNYNPQNFFMRGLFAPNKKFREVSTLFDEEDQQAYTGVEVVASNGYGLSRSVSGNVFVTGLIGNVYIKGTMIWGLNNRSTQTIGITSTIPYNPWEADPNIENYLPLAIIDKCPSKYYVIWYDRTGAYQCQPFNKRCVMTENIKTLTRTNLLNVTTPYSREIDNTWKLNSDWLTQDEYKAFESIFTSPITYLYDYDNDEMTQVNCLQSKWDEKTNKNSKKLYNLSIDLTIAKPQNIIY